MRSDLVLSESGASARGDSSMRVKLGQVNRAVAALLSLVWACAGIVGLVAAYAHGRWVLRAVGGERFTKTWSRLLMG